MNDNLPVKFCPYCGSDRVTVRRGHYSRCEACRMVWLIADSRRMKKLATKKPNR